ncbi:hypothetical protein GIB67_039946 [Kingdonia uniflora]|uniref:Protein kinase domain-containing protein n=1 Tax=Kingdonia uniflora TaxID=39325 RepID=A0A7J7P3I5_9MAGN|nr:hypothetical protein GIB67_039946 [Kingdonia uniflora]
MGYFSCVQVSDVYKRPTSESSPAKAVLDENSNASENRGAQLLGQIKHGSCRSRGILFKVLADTVGLESRLVVGLPSDGGIELADSYKHISVIVVLNSVELLVDLMRFPGQLVPCSSRAIFMSHISVLGESDSAENDSCDSPLEPNSPLCGVSDRVDMDSSEHDETLQSLYKQKLEAPSTLSGPPLRNIMLRSESSVEGNVSSSHSEPNIANVFWRRSRRKAIAEQRTASSRDLAVVYLSLCSPEHPFFRVRGRSMLSGHRHSFREYPEGMAASRSDGAPTPESRRLRRRSMSITPEIGDDIVRAVRAMNETLKQNRLLKDDVDDGSHSTHGKDVSLFARDSHNQISSEKSATYSLLKKQISSKKAVSLPSSPHEFRGQSSERCRPSNFAGSPENVSTWNKVLDSSALDNALLPFQEWNIDFSELAVGTRVGIGLEWTMEICLLLKRSVLVIETTVRIRFFFQLLGFFGEVFRGVWNGTDVAIKVFLEQDLTSEHIEDFCNEISILCRLRHPNVILFLGACMKPPQLSMVTEYMEMGSLYYLIHMSGQKKKISWRKRLKMLSDICRLFHSGFALLEFSIYLVAFGL